MRRFVEVELLKLGTVGLLRLFLVLAAAIVAATTVNAVSTIDPDRPAPFRGSESVRVLGEPAPEPEARLREEAELAIVAWSFTALLAFALGTVAAGTERSHRTLGASALAVPRRERLVAAKLLAAGAIALLLGLIGLALNELIALPWLSSESIHTGMGAQDWALLIAGGLAATGLAAGIGVAVGFLLPTPGTGIVTAVVCVLLVEPQVAGRAPEIAQFLPFHALDAAFRGLPDVGTADELPQGVGLLALSAWAAGLLALATRSLARRDLA